MMDQSQRTPLIDYDAGMSDHYTACLHGGAIGDALGTAKTLLVGERGHEETLAALDKAVELSQSDKPPHIAIGELGEGWVAEEALAIYLAGINWLLHFLEDFRR